MASQDNEQRSTNWALVTGGIAMFLAAVVITIYPQIDDKRNNIATHMDPAILVPAPSDN